MLERGSDLFKETVKTVKEVIKDRSMFPVCSLLMYDDNGFVIRQAHGCSFGFPNSTCQRCKFRVRSLSNIKRQILKEYHTKKIKNFKFIQNSLKTARNSMIFIYYSNKEIAETILSLTEEDLEEKKEAPVIDKEDKTWSIEINGENPCQSTHINDVLSSYSDNVEGIREGRQWNFEADYDTARIIEDSLGTYDIRVPGILSWINSCVNLDSLGILQDESEDEDDFTEGSLFDSDEIIQTGR